MTRLSLQQGQGQAWRGSESDKGTWMLRCTTAKARWDPYCRLAQAEFPAPDCQSVRYHSIRSRRLVMPSRW